MLPSEFLGKMSFKRKLIFFYNFNTEKFIKIR